MAGWLQRNEERVAKSRILAEGIKYGSLRNEIVREPRSMTVWLILKFANTENKLQR